MKKILFLLISLIFTPFLVQAHAATEVATGDFGHMGPMGSWFGWTFMVLFWILTVVAIIALVKWLFKK